MTTYPVTGYCPNPPKTCLRCGRPVECTLYLLCDVCRQAGIDESLLAEQRANQERARRNEADPLHLEEDDDGCESALLDRQDQLIHLIIGGA